MSHDLITIRPTYIANIVILVHNVKHEFWCILSDIRVCITVRLFHARRHAGEKVNWRHVHLVLSVRMRHLDGGKIAKHFVGRRELAHPVFVLDYLLASPSRSDIHRATGSKRNVHTEQHERGHNTHTVGISRICWAHRMVNYRLSNTAHKNTRIRQTENRRLKSQPPNNNKNVWWTWDVAELIVRWVIFTLGLFHAGRDGAQKVVGSEEHLNVVALLDANRGKIAEYFVGSGIRANAILVFDNLGNVLCGCEKAEQI